MTCGIWKKKKANIVFNLTSLLVARDVLLYLKCYCVTKYGLQVKTALGGLESIQGHELNIHLSAKCTLLAAMLCCSSIAFSQPTGDTQNEVLGVASLSGLPLVAHSILLNEHRQNDDDPPFSGNSGYSYLVESVPMLMPLPMYSYDLQKGLGYTLGGLGLYGAATMAQAANGPNQFSSLAYQIALKINMESTYEIYSDLRSRSSDQSYRNFTKYSFSEIALAPFSIKAIVNPVSLVIVPLYAVGAIAGNWELAKTKSVFATGKTYIWNEEFNPWIATSLTLVTAAGFAVQNSFEEAYWRGFMYEELKHRFENTSGSVSWLPASMISSALFTAWHGPIIGWSWNLVGTFVLGGLVIDWIYETGGLPAAGAAHGLANASLFVIGWLMTSGVPMSQPVEAPIPNPVKVSYSRDGMVISVSVPDLIGLKL